MSDAKAGLFVVRESKHGRGAFATNSIAAGTWITALTGELLSTLEVGAQINEQKISSDDPLQVANDLYVLLDPKSHYFNHSCNPNAGIRGYNSLIAIADIREGEEITFDYSTTVGIAPIHRFWTMECTCGATGCRKKLGSVLTIEPLQIRKYIRMNVLPKFIMEQITRA